MNPWLIGGGIYVVVLLFGLALCRVAAPTDESNTQSRGYATKPNRRVAEYEQIVALGTDQIEIVIHQDTGSEMPSEAPGTRPNHQRTAPAPSPTSRRVSR